MLKRTAIAASLIVLTMPASQAQEQRGPAPAAPPAAFTRAIECRSVADPQARLACYDREVAALAAAAQSNEIRVVDRQEIRRTRRSLFGITLPDLGGIFGGGGDGEEVSEINATIQSARQDAYGKWTIVLDDGARWQQIDTRDLASDPRPGQPIRIRRAAMGSFLANVNRQIAIRVRRVQ